MADQKPIIGIPQVDEALSALFEFAQDEGRLAVATEAIQDETRTPEQLQEAIPVRVLRVSLALLDKAQAGAMLESIAEEGKRKAFQQAIDLVSQHFRDLDRHPAILAELRRQLARQEKTRDDGENTISSVSWEAIWMDADGKLAPAARLKLRGHAETVLLASTMDWDDLTFLIRALCRILQRHMEMSKPVSKAELLEVPGSVKIGERLGDASAMLREISELARGFGITVAPALSDDVDDD